MTMENDVRRQVSTAYGKAISTVLGGGGGACACGGGGCCSGVEPTEALADLAGYGPLERAKHEQAAKSSFGCGNPLALAGIRSGQTVLDLGSGAGFDLLLAADLVGPTGKVLGVDMTDEMLAAARDNIKRAGTCNIELRKGYIEDLPVQDSSVDWVVSNCVVNLSPDKPAVFREIFRVLRPGGSLSISDIVARDLPPRILESARAHAACVAGALSEEQYLEGLAGAGFVDVDVTDRLVYSLDQLKNMLGSSLSGLLAGEGAEAVLESLSGTIWSARFTARKPV